MTGYRYTLTRTIPGGTGLLCWVMLNPSTADETVDDPTIRRVIRFTKDAGYGALIVVNLYAARTTRPIHLTEMIDPVGPDNEVVVEDAMAASDDVVFAWGAWLHHLPPRLRPRRINVHHLAERADQFEPKCLGKTVLGSPRHPLYVPAAQPLVPFA